MSRRILPCDSPEQERKRLYKRNAQRKVTETNKRIVKDIRDAMINEGYRENEYKRIEERRQAVLARMSRIKSGWRR